MFHAIKILNRRIRCILLLSLGFAALVFMGPVAALGAGPAPVDLGSAGNFVILAETGITNTGSHTSVITGDIGNSPGSAAQMNDVWCSEITGTIYGVDAAYTGSGDTTCFAGNPPLANKTLVDNAVGDMLTAYNNAASVVAPAPVTELGAGNIGGMTLAPGLYKWSTDVNIADNLTLSGGASDVWILQIAGDLNVASAGSVATGIKVILSGGALASNVFWQVGGVTGATLGTYATFNGTILSAKQIICQTGAVLNGRALAQTQVTLDANVVTNVAGCPPITLLPSVLPAGMVGAAYSQTITASGGAEPYTFTMTAGALPTGLSPITTGGVIAGTPTATGTFTFTVTAADANGCTGSQAYTLVINADGCPPIALLPTVLPEGMVGAAYNQTITASGGAEPYTFIMTAGALPIGLSPITTGGVIAGTPTATGTFTFTVTATDQNGCTGLQAYTLIINAAPPAPIPTLSEWGMIILMTIMGLTSIYYLRRRKVDF